MASIPSSSSPALITLGSIGLQQGHMMSRAATLAFWRRWETGCVLAWLCHFTAWESRRHSRGSPAACHPPGQGRVPLGVTVPRWELPLCTCRVGACLEHGRQWGWRLGSAAAMLVRVTSHSWDQGLRSQSGDEIRWHQYIAYYIFGFFSVCIFKSVCTVSGGWILEFCAQPFSLSWVLRRRDRGFFVS